MISSLRESFPIELCSHSLSSSGSPAEFFRTRQLNNQRRATSVSTPTVTACGCDFNSGKRGFTTEAQRHEEREKKFFENSKLLINLCVIHYHILSSSQDRLSFFLNFGFSVPRC